MPLHVSTELHVRRTPEELRSITSSIEEIDEVIDGYPALDQRYFLDDHEYVPLADEVKLFGYKSRIYEFPVGHDATQSSERMLTLANDAMVAEFLLGAPHPDRTTGSDWRMPDDHPAVRHAIKEGCRDFTQHLQPLVPGWEQLARMRGSKGQPVGMPLGIGRYTHYLLSLMSDAASLRLSEDRSDLEVWLYERDADKQSEWVWATPGGYIIKSDSVQADMTPIEAGTARRTMDRSQGTLDVSHLPGVLLPPKYPISSGNTLVAGQENRSIARFDTAPTYDEPPITGRTNRPMGWISLRTLVANNPTGGVAGTNHEDIEMPIWTTHFEYATQGMLAIANPNNQRQLRMSDRDLADVTAIKNDLVAQYDVLRTA
jgi:hypothetical protein